MNNVSCQYTGASEVYFDTREEAEQVLNDMKNICDRDGAVTVYDFSRILGFSEAYPGAGRDKKYVWVRENMDVAHVEERGDQFGISILPAMHIGYLERNEMVKNDPVNHPSHYKSKAGLETIDVIDAFTADLAGTEAVCTANVIKYICRWKHKNGLQDLKKAKWYLEHLINHMKKEND